MTRRPPRPAQSGDGPQILEDPRCGWCNQKGIRHAGPLLPGEAPRERRSWTGHDVQCPVLNPYPGPHRDGYPVCALITGHAGDCDYTRHVMPKAA